MATYFASGSNRPGEIRGFSEIRHALGVAVPDVVQCEAATREIEDAKVPVFVDSGAFSEVAFGPEGPRVVKPIGDADWRARLRYAGRIADALGENLYFVAPDKVGFPAETLGRLSRYRREVREIAGSGARVLVALQGADKVDFWRKVRLLDLAPEERLVAALPMKKNATTPEEVIAFARAARPRAVHLLGLGLANRKAAPLIEALEALGVEVSLDSNLIRANVGRGEKPRKLTLANDEAADELHCHCWRDAAEDGMGVPVDYTDEIGAPSGWITGKGLRRFAELAGLDEDEARAWRRDPDAWLQEGERYLWPHVSHALDAVWAEFHWRVSTPERKRRGVRKAFGA